MSSINGPIRFKFHFQELNQIHSYQKGNFHHPTKTKMDPFEKQMEERFMRDLQNIQIGDSDSELQSSTDFYEGLKQKINSQITSMRASTTKNTILQELKANLNKQISNVQKFQDQIKEMKLLNTTAQSAIAQQKIQQIKTKLAKQNLSRIVFADEQVEMKEKQQSRIKLSQNQLQSSAVFSSNQPNKSTQTKNFQKKKTKTSVNDELDRKISHANLERQRINMEREDELSMKYEQFFISQFFKERFLQFKVPKTQTIQMSIHMKITKPKSTFTNLAPLPNNEKNVLPKNSPQIALKTLKKNKRVSLAPISQATIKIEFKKVELSRSNLTKSKTQIKNNSNELVGKTLRQNNFKDLLEPYLKSISQPIAQLQKISSFYKPKFIKNYLNEDQKISNIDMSETTGSQRSVQQIMMSNTQFQIQGQKDSNKLKQFKLTFENVTSLKGIQEFASVEYVALQFNIIKNVKQLTSCRKLIQLNLSNNSIKDARPLSDLSQLRYLNLNHNKVSQFQFQGGSLEILKLKSNNIEIINDLNKNKYLRYVDLSQNKLHELGKGFTQLYFLQELNLQKNYISTLNGSQNLIMLQKLNLSHNRIKLIEKKLIFMFLNFLDLSYNQMEKIGDLFLPSLQKLYITNNKLTGENIGKTTIYLPQLKEFNIDDNQIKGFSIIWFFIRYSKNLQILKYDSNEYFLSVRQKVRQLYEAIIYRNMKHIKILNHSPYDSGIKAYYQSVYSSYLDKNSKLSVVAREFQRVEQLISFLVEENKMIVNLESQNHKQRNQRFTEQNVFIQAKSVKRALFLHKVLSMLAQNLANSTQNSIMSNSLPVIKIHSQIYFHHDKFQSDLLKKTHKIKTFFYRMKYTKEKRNKYFMKKKPVLSKLVKQISNMITLNSIRKVVNIFAKALKQNKKESAALIIQKRWRGYKSRKLFRKMMKKLKNKTDDSFELQQVDLDDFETHQLPQFNFQLPDDINFDNYIIEPKYFQIAEEKNKKRNSKANQKLDSIQEKQQEEYNPMMNNFVKEEKIKEEKNEKKQDDERLMKEWGFQNPASLQALKWKKKRKQEMKKKEAEQNLTATQRYQKFKMMHK